MLGLGWDSAAAQEVGAAKRVGLIGSGWYGKVDLMRLIQVAPVEVVGLCDVDSRMLSEAGELVASKQVSRKTPLLFSDYRDMFAKEAFDIILVDTPDHWHALPAIAAMEAGADVWVQKPIGVDLAEGYTMLDTARQHQRVVQVGLQRRGTPHLMEAKSKVIDEGLLGKIGQVEICCYHGMGRHRTAPESSPPEHLDFEMWTGPAPMRPYNNLIHSKSWRGFMEYGNGILGDMGVHMLDTVRWMLSLNAPKSIHSTGGTFVHKNATPNIADTQTATFEFDDLNVVWNHRAYGTAPDPEYPWAFFIYGEKGTLKGSVHKWDFVPHERGQKTMGGEALTELEEYPDDKLPGVGEPKMSPGIRTLMRDFLKCIETRERPMMDIEEGHISSGSCILGNMAMDLERGLHWDYTKRELTDDPEANQKMARPYRGPWVHPSS